MKEWKEIPEYREAWDIAVKNAEKFCQDRIGKKIVLRGEFDDELHNFHVKQMRRLRDVQDKYRKEHPEEFDENGNFKEDTK